MALYSIQSRIGGLGSDEARAGSDGGIGLAGQGWTGGLDWWDGGVGLAGRVGQRGSDWQVGVGQGVGLAGRVGRGDI